MMTVTEAAEAGRSAGKAAGSWVLDGNSLEATARRIVDGYEEGDPEVLDMAPSPLSGEMAGGSLSELGLEGADEDVLDAFENAFDEGYWEEVLSSAQAMLDHD